MRREDGNRKWIANGNSIEEIEAESLTGDAGATASLGGKLALRFFASLAHLKATVLRSKLFAREC